MLESVLNLCKVHDLSYLFDDMLGNAKIVVSLILIFILSFHNIDYTFTCNDWLLWIINVTLIFSDLAIVDILAFICMFNWFTDISEFSIIVQRSDAGPWKLSS